MIFLSHNEEIYDDSDFYQQLLKEYIADITEEDVSALDEGHGKSKLLKHVKKKGVDVKASKGRRIRYTIHDKLVR